ncbi:MAG: hypothetical protein EBQ96_09315 [Proteobacteria bacterium]|nr:hypothetical protein [Pseudomonadota bacterium]
MAGTHKEAANPQSRVGQSIDCTNSLDVRPVAKAVVDFIKAMAPNYNPQRPLVIIMAETHTIPTQILSQYAVLDKLSSLPPNERVPFAFGLEHPHDELEKTLFDAAGAPLPDHLKGWVTEADTTGRRTIAAALAHRTYEFSPETEAILAELCIRRNISAKFNDAARRNGDFIDLDDPLTASFAKKKQLGTDIDIRTEEGMRFRNQMIAALAMEHIREQGVPVYIQQCGAIHAVGSTALDSDGNTFPTKDSLARAFEDMGAQVVVVMHDEHLERGIPQAALRFLSHGMCINGLSRREFNVGETTDEIRHIRDVSLESELSLNLIMRELYAEEIRERLENQRDTFVAEAQGKHDALGGVLPLRR